MKKTVSEIVVIDRMNKLNSQMGGVYSTADLHHLMSAGSVLANQRAIKRLRDAGKIFQCQRGLYVTEGFNLWLLAARLFPKIYVSMDSILAKNGLIGTQTEYKVSVVGVVPRKTLRILNKTIHAYSIKPDLFFGFSSTPKGIQEADNEKAFLDLLYYYNRGYKFSIDPLAEVNKTGLNLGKIKKYLKSYQNPKFVTFVKGVLHG